MKTLLLLLLVVATTTTACAGNLNGFETNTVLLGHGHKMLLPTPAINAKRSLAFKLPVRYDDEDRCDAYRKFVIVGAVAVPVGLGLIGGGGYLIHYGSNQEELDDAPFIVTGTLCVLTGVILFAGGTPILAIGIKQMGKYCNSDNSQSMSISLIKRANTAGLALRF